MADNDALSMLKAGQNEWGRWAENRRSELVRSRKQTLRELVTSQEQRVPRPIDLSGAILREAHLAAFNLSMVNLDDADLSSADLDGADLWLASLRNANLANAWLPNVRLSEASCENADFSHSTLYRARCVGTDFRQACFVNADLTEAVLMRCDMDGADLSLAACSSTVWADIDLRGVKNLANVQHNGPSTIGFDAVLASGGAIPEAFLRGCGLPDLVITYVTSLAQSENPIQLYSCFISHSNMDEEFCQRLHNDLQAAGVRCWFAPEDLKIGDRFRDSIESAIRMHDKLLLVLSDNSVQSDWVRSEVEGAFERETRERKRVLFPVRLDDAVMDTPKAWAADIRRQRHIGDFSGWKDHDSYKLAFDRLLRDLRAVPSA